MKVSIERKYKRKLSKASLDAMSAGGKSGSVEDKRKAGKLGWQAMVKNLVVQLTQPETTENKQQTEER